MRLGRLALSASAGVETLLAWCRVGEGVIAERTFLEFDFASRRRRRRSDFRDESWAGAGAVLARSRAWMEGLLDDRVVSPSGVVGDSIDCVLDRESEITAVFDADSTVGCIRFLFFLGFLSLVAFLFGVLFGILLASFSASVLATAFADFVSCSPGAVPLAWRTTDPFPASFSAPFCPSFSAPARVSGVGTGPPWPGPASSDCTRPSPFNPPAMDSGMVGAGIVGAVGVGGAPPSPESNRSVRGPLASIAALPSADPTPVRTMAATAAAAAAAFGRGPSSSPPLSSAGRSPGPSGACLSSFSTDCAKSRQDASHSLRISGLGQCTGPNFYFQRPFGSRPREHGEECTPGRCKYLLAPFFLRARLEQAVTTGLGGSVNTFGYVSPVGFGLLCVPTPHRVTT